MGIAAVGAAAAVASAAYNISGGNSPDSSGGASGQGFYGGSSPPPTYQPQSQPQADQFYSQNFGAMQPYATSIPQQLLPQYQQYLQTTNPANNPYATGFQGGATQAGYQSTANAQQAAGNANQLTGMGQQAQGYLPFAGAAIGQSGNALKNIGYADNILQTGFDPQKQLYDRTYQQFQDQQRANLAMTGQSNTPYGAGLLNQGSSNFNIDWQNAQLGRQQAALGAAGGFTGQLYGADAGLLGAGTNAYSTLQGDAGRAYQGAADLGGYASQQYLAGGYTPYAAYGQQQGDYLSGLNNFSGGALNAFGVPQQQQNNLQSYLGLGQSGSNIGRLNANTQFGQQQQIGQGIGNLVSQLGGAFGGGGSSGGFDTGGASTLGAFGANGTFGQYGPVFGSGQQFGPQYQPMWPSSDGANAPGNFDASGFDVGNML